MGGLSVVATGATSWVMRGLLERGEVSSQGSPPGYEGALAAAVARQSGVGKGDGEGAALWEWAGSTGAWVTKLLKHRMGRYPPPSDV